MNRSSILLIVLSLVLLGGVIWYKQSKQIADIFTIAIIQTTSHPALDAVRNGFIETVQKTFPATQFNFIVKNGQGSITNLHTIAQQLHTNQSINAFLAIATPALQAIAGVEKERPIGFGAVTDPVSAGIKDQDNVYGVTDIINISEYIKNVTQLLPEVKQMALLFNSAEANSVSQVNLMEEALKAQGIEPKKIAVSQQAELPTAVNFAVRSADALLIPTDNMMADAIDLIVELSKQAYKPLLASHNQAVESGALMAQGVDYYKSGQQIALLFAPILQQNKSPLQIGIHKPDSSTLVINQKTFDFFKLQLPTGWKNRVTFV